MICPQCRAENADTNRFCIKCGAPLPAATSPTAPPAPPPQAPPNAPPAAPPPPPVVSAPHQHFARTGTVLLISAAVVAVIFFLFLAVGVVLVLNAASRRATSAGGIRPATGQPSPSGGGGAPAPAGPQNPPPAAPAPVPPSGGGAPAPVIPPPSGGGAPAPNVPAPTAPPPPAPAPHPPAQPSAPAPQPPGQQRVPVQRYRGSNGRWSIDAPQRWQVSEAPNGTVVVFYYDDPNEGTAFAVIPFQTLQGEMGAKDVLVRIAQGIQEHSPDLQMRINSVRDMSQGSMSAQAVDADAAWTGGRGQAMRGHVNVITFSQRGSGTTTFVFLGGQSPTQVFDTVRPVFAAMAQSFKGNP